jgi:hypothetical protein
MSMPIVLRKPGLQAQNKHNPEEIPGSSAIRMIKCRSDSIPGSGCL